MSNEKNSDANNNESNAPNEETKFDSYPEAVEFTGVAFTSLKQVHISAFLIVLVGAIIAVLDPPGGFILLIAFLLIVLVIETWMIRRSRKEVTLSLLLRKDPVEAVEGSYKVGEIKFGSIEPDMDEPTELGFRPTPKHDLIVWTFRSKQDKDVASKRLLEYLPRDQ